MQHLKRKLGRYKKQGRELREMGDLVSYLEEKEMHWTFLFQTYRIHEYGVFKVRKNDKTISDILYIYLRPERMIKSALYITGP